MSTRYILFGIAFGFILSRAGATDYDAIAGMFRLSDLHLVGVIGTAVSLNALGFWLLRRAGARTWGGGAPLSMPTKPMVPGLLAASLVFGAGWAIAGTCPGTALAQIGEGRLAAVATFAGILLGSWWAQRRPPATPVSTC